MRHRVLRYKSIKLQGDWENYFIYNKFNNVNYDIKKKKLLNKRDL